MDVKGFYPYIRELVNDVFKFKQNHVKTAKEILNKMNPNQSWNPLRCVGSTHGETKGMQTKGLGNILPGI